MQIGNKFLQVASRAVLVGLEDLPIAGTVIKIGRECWNALRDYQDKFDLDARIAQIEQAGQIAPDAVPAIVNAAAQDLITTGHTISPERIAAVTSLVQMMPGQIQARTQATLRNARQQGTQLTTVLPVTNHFTPIDREAFYTGLFPQRWPQFKIGDPVPERKDWHLERFLGAGGFGEVWLARQQGMRSKPPMAIKFCQDDHASAKLLSKEGEYLDLLMEKLPAGTAHIVALLDMQRMTMPYWLGFEYIDGGTLESKMRLGPMDWSTAWNIFQPILQAMAQVHRLEIVHRDLKPANILLTTNNEPRIADFGIGKLLTEPDAKKRALQRSQSMTTRWYGSPGYMSPEQELGQKGHPADDVYALGLLLWEMLAGNTVDARYQVGIQQLAVPKAVQNAIATCLLPRAMRFADAGTLLANLEQAQVTSKSSSIVSFFTSQLQPASKPAPVPTTPVVTVPISKPSIAQNKVPKPWNPLFLVYTFLNQSFPDMAFMKKVSTTFMAKLRMLKPRTALIPKPLQSLSLHRIGQIWTGLGLIWGSWLTYVFVSNASYDLSLQLWGIFLTGFHLAFIWFLWITVMRGLGLLDQLGIVPGWLYHLLACKAWLNTTEEFCWYCLFRPLVRILLFGLVTIFLPTALWVTNPVMKKGHSEGISSVAFSPSGQQILTSSYDNTARLWDVNSGKALQVFHGYSKDVNSVAFAPNGQQVLTGSDDKTARLWDVNSGQQLQVFRGHSDDVNSVAFAPNGQQVLTVSGDGTARLWDVHSGQQLQIFRNVNSVAFAPNGQQILTGSYDKTARLWDVHSGQELKIFRGHSKSFSSVAFAPNGQQVLIGYDDNTARLWDVNSGKALQVFRGHSDWIRSVTFAPNGQQVLTGSDDNTARLWDVNSGQQLQVFRYHSNSVGSVAFAPNGQQVLTGSYDGTARLWDVASGKEIWRTPVPFWAVRSYELNSYGFWRNLIILIFIFIFLPTLKWFDAPVKQKQ